ncbi:MAG: helix-turn-helix domain-containing protein [Sphingomonadaceae bacterium]
MRTTRLSAKPQAGATTLAIEGAPLPGVSVGSPAPVVYDRYRAFVFPNRIREVRRARGFPKLMALSAHIPEIPYIRLSKIERGEVIARAGELEQIGKVLAVAPTDLLIDVTHPDFDIATWAQPFHDSRFPAEDEERFAVMMAAALRKVRAADASLTITALDKKFGLPPVILSRLENAYKTFDRWNPATVVAVCKVFGVADESALRKLVITLYRCGDLDRSIGTIADPSARIARTRHVNMALRAELASIQPSNNAAAARAVRAKAPLPTVPEPAMPIVPSMPSPEQRRDLRVLGSPLSGGLIAPTQTDASVTPPMTVGPRAFALRVCRATLGAGLPANAIVIVDPDRRPTAGSLAVVRYADGYRILTITFDRTGATKGYSVVPDFEADIDALDPADVHAVIAAIYV